MERDVMTFDVLIVGAGPAGLAAACRLMQQAQEQSRELSVCVLEKGSEVGAHILSGAVFEPRALTELFPDWKERGAPVTTPVSADAVHWLSGATTSRRIPGPLVPPGMHNNGNYVISLANLCRWLAEQAESLGAEIYPGFPAAELILEDGVVQGVITGAMGVSQDGTPKEGHVPGMELRAAYTLFSEGAHGHLGQQLLRQFDLDTGCDPQHYGLGLKELWQVPGSQHAPGSVIHSTGWPLTQSGSTGGGFLYHLDNNQVAVGLITDLSYSNPHVDPFLEFQRLKHHPLFASVLNGGERVSYGARAIAKGGWHALPRMHFPGGLLLGCDAGTLNNGKIKGSHTAMKSGLLGADAVFAALGAERRGEDLTEFTQSVENSWLGRELQGDRNTGPAMHRFGNLGGGMLTWVASRVFRQREPWTLNDRTPDHATLKPAADCPEIDYPKPDGKLSFDRLSSVFLSNTAHEEDQPVHLKLTDTDIPLRDNLPRFNEPAQRYCPAGVYEVVSSDNGTTAFQINAQNCVHCKTCDIKDPAQNITWVPPEGGGGPNYPNM